MKRKPGVKIKDDIPGDGEEAGRGKTVVVNVRMFLNRGTELMSTFAGGQKIKIDLGRRECIPGLRYGIEGMRIGGQRVFTISPHLAYGTDGVPGHVPPHAVIRCEVELLDIRKPGETYPEDYPPGKQLFVFQPGEAGRDLSRWQFGLYADGRCGATITEPQKGLAWRHARHLSTETRLDEAISIQIIEEALRFPKDHPSDCIDSEGLWADMKERGNAITRDRARGILCLTVSIMERGSLVCQYSVREDSSSFVESRMCHTIKEILDRSLFQDRKNQAERKQ